MMGGHRSPHLYVQPIKFEVLPFHPNSVEAELYYLKEDYALGVIGLETLEYEINRVLTRKESPRPARPMSPTYREY